MAKDFDRLFAGSLSQYSDKIEKMTEAEVEEFAERLYEQWLHTPNTDLLGETPVDYFKQYTPRNQCEALLEYVREGKHIPDPLSYEILDGRLQTEQILIDILREERSGAGAKAIIGLLTEMQSREALPLLISMAADEGLEAEAADSAAEAVIAIGGAAHKALEMLPFANTDQVEDRLADIICNANDYTFSQKAFESILELFRRRRDQRAFYASCLAKLGDDRAVEVLRHDIAQPGVSYFEYMAMRDALEAMGELIELDREFYGDEDFEYMRSMEE